MPKAPIPIDIERVRALADAHLVATSNAFGVENFPLIPEDDPEYLPLKAYRPPMVLGLDPSTLPLCTVIGLLPAAEIAARFGGYAEAVHRGIEVRNGAVLLYGLQTAAIRDQDAAAAEALIRAAHAMVIFFQFDFTLIGVLDPERADTILQDLVKQWNPKRALIVWSLLEDHRSWSPELSHLVLDSIADAGSASRNGIWTFRGNGLAENLHPSAISRALDILRPLSKTERNAKRWATKLRKRLAAT